MGFKQSRSLPSPQTDGYRVIGEVLLTNGTVRHKLRVEASSPRHVKPTVHLRVSAVREEGVEPAYKAEGWAMLDAMSLDTLIAQLQQARAHIEPAKPIEEKT